MEPEANVQVPSSGSGRAAGRRWLAWAAIFAVLPGAFLVWARRQHDRAAEAAAIKELEAAGVLIVRDAGGVHAASANLSTMTSASKAEFDHAVEHLADLTHLASLDASRTQIDDQHLAVLGTLPALTSLAANETGVTDAGLAHLGGAGRLEALYLASTRATNACLPTLGGLTNLRILDLSATQVTGDLGPLARLPRLEWLVLRELKLDDEALAELAACPALKRLSLEGTDYSADSLSTLRKSVRGLSADVAAPAAVEAPPGE